MILAAGLTPAWQQILCFEHFRWGEVNRASQAHWCGSGKVLNVGLALHHLGCEAVTIAPLGGVSGQMIRAEMEQLGLAGDWIETSRPTRVCTTLLDAATHTTTELVENAAPLLAEELNRFRAQFRRRAASAKVMVLAGSLPADTPRDVFAEMVQASACPLVLDIRGEELRRALAAARRGRQVLVKPNREELALTLGRDFDNDSTLVAGMRELITLGATWVLISQGKDPAWLASVDGVWRCMPPEVASAVNPIACGDCLAAGIAAGWRRGLDTPSAVQWGMAAAAVNLTDLLPARLELERVRALVPQVVVQSA